MNRIDKQAQDCRPVKRAAAPQALELLSDDSLDEDALFARDDHDRREMLLADARADAEELERQEAYTLAQSDAALMEGADDELINLKPILDYLEHARLHAAQKPAIRIAFAGHEAILKARSLGWGGDPTAMS